MLNECNLAQMVFLVDLSQHFSSVGFKLLQQSVISVVRNIQLKFIPKNMYRAGLLTLLDI